MYSVLSFTWIAALNEWSSGKLIGRSLYFFFHHAPPSTPKKIDGALVVKVIESCALTISVARLNTVDGFFETSSMNLRRLTSPYCLPSSRRTESACVENTFVEYALFSSSGLDIQNRKTPTIIGHIIKQQIDPKRFMVDFLIILLPHILFEQFRIDNSRNHFLEM